MIQVEWNGSGQDDKVLMLQIIVAVFSLDVIHCVDEGYMFCTPKIMGPQLKTLKFCLKFCSVYKYGTHTPLFYYYYYNNTQSEYVGN
jgi:hypothetical protein